MLLAESGRGRERNFLSRGTSFGGAHSLPDTLPRLLVGVYGQLLDIQSDSPHSGQACPH